MPYPAYSGRWGAWIGLSYGAGAAIDVHRGENTRFREGLRGLSDDELAVMARQSPAVHFATCVRIQNKDNEPILPVPNMRGAFRIPLIC